MGLSSNSVGFSAMAALVAGCAAGGPGGDHDRPWAGGTTHAVPQLISESTMAIPGDVVRVGVRFAIEPGWHLYWNGRNDSGYAPRLTLQAPEGYGVGAWCWPAPRRLVQPGGLVDHVYDDSLLLTASLQVPASACADEDFTVSFEGEWLACRRECVGESGSGQLRIRVGQSRVTSAWAGEFRRAEAAAAAPWTDGPDRYARIAADVAEFRVPGARHMEFYPSEDCAEIADLPNDGAANGDVLRVRLAGAGPVRGILRAMLGPGGGACYQISIPAAGAGSGTSGQTTP